MKDKTGVKFIRTTMIGGLVFLVPLIFLVFILDKALGYMKIIAEPLAGSPSRPSEASCWPI